MNIVDIIIKKRERNELTKEEIEYFVRGYTEGRISDYQAAALVMAIFLNGMTDKEITNLTLAMAYSGEVLNLNFDKIIVDKHSTGGVGDKVSLILLPLVSSLGVPVAKMSGRGLGFTGGTVDKLQSIPGYNTEIDFHTFEQNVEIIGISMISQTGNLAPADKKLYALRDTIGCVESMPLIASSIMSKKIASGADKIVLEVTYGNGAFMQTLDDAKRLGDMMVKIGELAGKETVCVFTNMDQPLGKAVGNTLEIIETINFLKGNFIPDVLDVVLETGSWMIKLAGLGEDLEKNKTDLLENLKNGKAYDKFLQLVENQGGDINYIKDPEKFEKAKYIECIYADKDGKIEGLNAKDVGQIVCMLGAGRVKKEDSIDFLVGIILNKKQGDIVRKGDILAEIHANDKNKLENAKIQLKNTYFML